MEPVYIYRATLHRVIDGDTCVLDIDLGFYVFVGIHIRVRDLRCPEMRTPEGKVAAEKARQILSAATQLIVQSYHDQRSFERWVADLWVDGVSFKTLMETPAV